MTCRYFIFYSNMTSFIGYENNTIIKFPICFTSHMHITGHGYHSLVIPNIYTDGWLMVINPLSTIFQSYRIVVHLNIKLFVAFLYISFCNTKDFDISKLLSFGDIVSKYEWWLCHLLFTNIFFDFLNILLVYVDNM